MNSLVLILALLAQPTADPPPGTPSQPVPEQSTETPVDERPLLGLHGPVLRVTERQFPIKLKAEGRVEMEPLLKQVILFDQQGRLKGLRTGTGNAKITRDKESGRIDSLSSPTGSRTRIERTVETFDEAGRLTRRTVMGDNSVVISDSTFTHDEEGRIIEEIKKSSGVFTATYITKTEYDTAGLPREDVTTKKGSVFSRRTYRTHLGTVVEESILGADGTLLESYKIRTDQHGNWIERLHSKRAQGSGTAMIEVDVVRREITYLQEPTPPAGTPGG